MTKGVYILMFGIVIEGPFGLFVASTAGSHYHRGLGWWWVMMLLLFLLLFWVFGLAWVRFGLSLDVLVEPTVWI